MSNNKQSEMTEGWPDLTKAYKDPQFYYPLDAVYEHQSVFPVSPYVKSFFKASSSEEQEIFLPVKQIACSSKIFRIKEDEDRIVYAVHTEIYTERPTLVYSYKFQQESCMSGLRGFQLGNLIERDSDGLSKLLKILGYPPFTAGNCPAVACDHDGKPERYFSVFHIGDAFKFVGGPVESSVK